MKKRLIPLVGLGIFSFVLIGCGSDGQSVKTLDTTTTMYTTTSTTMASTTTTMATTTTTAASATTSTTVSHTSTTVSHATAVTSTTAAPRHVNDAQHGNCTGTSSEPDGTGDCHSIPSNGGK